MFLPPGFDKAIALESAGLVQQAYDQYEHFVHNQPWSLQGDYDHEGDLWAKPEGILAHREPFGFVVRNRTSHNVFVVFRGTKSLDDWLSDFTFPQNSAFPWGPVEDGFWFIYRQCSADVKTLVKTSLSPAGVFTTGHSLGAALAVLATADLVNCATARDAKMYSFAGPRVGDPAFAGVFAKRVTAAWRIVNTEDIVTTVPLATPSLFSSGIPHSPLSMLLALSRNLNFHHVGVPVSFSNNTGTIPGNHAMQTYLDALKSAA